MSQFFVAFEPFNLFKQGSLLLTIDHMNVPLPNCAEVDQKLHADSRHKCGLVSCFAHLEQYFYVFTLLLPRQKVRVSFHYDDVNQVKPLNEIGENGEHSLFHCQDYFCPIA